MKMFAGEVNILGDNKNSFFCRFTVHMLSALLRSS